MDLVLAMSFACLLGAVVVAWLWRIPAAARLAISTPLMAIPLGTALLINGVGLYRVIAVPDQLTLVVQPPHPWSPPWR